MPVSDDIQVVVFDHRGIHAALYGYLRNFDHVKLWGKPSSFHGEDLLVVWRNQAVKWFLEKTELPWLLFVDDDIEPTPEIEQLVHCDAEAAGVRFVAKHGSEAHGEDGEFGMACVKVSRAALEKIEPPWFMFEFNEDGTETKACECQYFCRKLRAVGVHPIKVGLVQHTVRMQAMPGAEEGEVKLRWGNNRKMTAKGNDDGDERQTDS